MTLSDSVHISAGGHGTRLREQMTAEGYPEYYPKHLLPTGNNGKETLLGRIMRQALQLDTEKGVTLHVNHLNVPFIKNAIGNLPIEVSTTSQPNFMMPYIEALGAARRRVVGSAGDFYIEEPWQNMMDAHASSKFPVTFMIGTSPAVDEGLTFDIDDRGRINRLMRLERTTGEEMINIGLYVFEAHRTVIDALASLRPIARHSSEAIASCLMERGLVGAYEVKGIAFNVNTPESYGALLAHTSQAGIDCDA